MTMPAAERISRAKVQLILNQPFWATLALGLRYEEDPAIKTASTDGKTLKYNPAFIEGLPSLEEVTGVIAHEVAHVASLHHTRRAGRDPKRWNRAADYAINGILTASNFHLPAGALLSDAYEGLSAEEIYQRLADEEPEEQGGGGDEGGDEQQDNDPGGTGGVEDAPAQTQAELKQIEAETKQATAQAAQIARAQGQLPAHLARLVEETLRARVDWKAVLSAFLTERTATDYNWTQPNRRYLAQGIYLPSLNEQTRGRFAVIIDTSASVDEDLLREFLAEVQSVAHEVAAALVVLHVDTEVNSAETYEPGDDIPTTAHGGGGTDFRPGFAWLDEHGEDPAAVVYLTDGICNSYPAAPGAPVLWAQYGGYKFSPPFGEVLRIDE